MSDDDLIRLLLEIERLALSKYPFTQADGPLNAELCVTLGMIGGMCSRAVEEYRARHPQGFI